MGKSVGLGIGAIVGGFLNEIFYSHVDLLMSLGLFTMAIPCACVPQVDELWFVALMLFFIGFGEGIINTGQSCNTLRNDSLLTKAMLIFLQLRISPVFNTQSTLVTGGNPMVMYLWEEKAAPYMHVLHFGFGLGALLAPQIARPFLAPESEDENYTSCADSVNGTSSTASESRIEIPYAIIGIFVFCFAWVILFFYVRGTPKGYPVRVPNTELKVLLSASSCSPGYISYGIGLLTLLFLYFIQAVGGERAYGKFLFSFAVEADVAFTKDEASYLQTAFWASFTLGRLLGGPVAKFMPLNWLIIGDITGALITAVVLSIWGATHTIVLWVFSCFMGIFISLVFPNGMSWSNLQLQMNSMAVMLLLFGGSVGGFFYQAVTGSLFENVGPETMMYVMVGYAVALAIVYALMQITVVCHTRNLPSGETDEMEMDMVVVGKNAEESGYGTIKMPAENSAVEIQDDSDTVKLNCVDEEMSKPKFH